MRAEVIDATRRTRLAGERTELAWWRTGLTALAVALGVGRVVPELNHGHARWPYVVAGVGYAIWGIVAIAYGSARGSAVEEDLSRGRVHHPPDWVLGLLTGGGIVLGAITAVLILLD
jgi:putative membrane protein